MSNVAYSSTAALARHAKTRHHWITTPPVTLEDDQRIWLTKLPERNDKLNMQRIGYATLKLAGLAGLDVCGTRREKVGSRDALMLERFDRTALPDLI